MDETSFIVFHCIFLSHFLQIPLWLILLLQSEFLGHKPATCKYKLIQI